MIPNESRASVVAIYTAIELRFLPTVRESDSFTFTPLYNRVSQATQLLSSSISTDSIPLKPYKPSLRSSLPPRFPSPLSLHSSPLISSMLSRTRLSARQLSVQLNAVRAVSVWSKVPAGPPDPILGKLLFLLSIFL